MKASRNMEEVHGTMIDLEWARLTPLLDSHPHLSEGATPETT